MKEWAAKGITTFSLDMLPRTTRAQAMDVLSSQANIAGYKAVLTAANLIQQVFSHVYDSSRKYCACKSVDTWVQVLQVCRLLLLPGDWVL